MPCRVGVLSLRSALYRHPWAILRGVLLAWSGAALLCGTGVPAQERAVIEPVGEVTWDEILAAEAGAARAPGGEPAGLSAVPFMPGPAPRDIGGPGGRVAPAERAPVAAATSAAGPTTITGFAALDDDGTRIPPDTMGAVGPNHLLVMLNTQVRIASKTGTTMSTVSLSSFWTSGTGLAGNPFDPHVVFDPLSNRWLATAFADPRSATSAVWFAISATNDPTGTWHFYQWRTDATGATWADYPGLGVNATWVAITANMFGLAGEGTYAGVKMWVLDKAALLAGGSPTMTTFPTGFDRAAGFSSFTLTPVLSFDRAEPRLYIVDNPYLVQNGVVPVLRLSQISGTERRPCGR